MVQAWAALAPVSVRDCYRGVAEVSIYVATGFLGQGIGSEADGSPCRRIRAQRHLEPLFIHLSRKPGDAQAAPADTAFGRSGFASISPSATAVGETR